MTRADDLVIKAVEQMRALVRGREMRRRSSQWSASWQQASADDRRALLAEVVDSVTLLPRPAGNRHGRGRPKGRALRIAWEHDWSVAAFAHAGSTSTLTPGDPDIRTSRGKTWAEWQRELRARR